MAYTRRPPPLLVQILFGIGMEQLFGSAIRFQERRGRAVRTFSAIAGRLEKRARRKNPLRNYVPGPQDVFVMTYAKSGTNWMMQIAHQLIYHGKGEYDHLHEIVPWPDTTIMPLFMKKYAIPLEEATHWKLYGRGMPTVDTWFELYLSPHFPLGGSWAVNAAGYWAERDRPNVLVVSFKSMKRDLRSTVLKVADFLNIHVSDALVDEVCRLSSFDHMKKNDHKYAIGQVVPWRQPGSMIRKGQEGGSSELLSRERQRLVDQHFIAELKALGSDFPYTEFCDLAP